MDITSAKKITAVYPGTFDPVTNGHIDIIARSAQLFDRVIAAVLQNAEKQPLFTVQERLEMLSAATSQWPNVLVESFAGLLVEYAARHSAQVIVRGIRAVSDYEYELQMASMNRRLNPALETVFMLPAETYSYLSSKLVKEIFLLGGSVQGLVPEGVEMRLRERAGKSCPASFSTNL
jgi:pantetheine-phosphate adenylyltransferase